MSDTATKVLCPYCGEDGLRSCEPCWVNFRLSDDSKMPNREVGETLDDIWDCAHIECVECYMEYDHASWYNNEELRAIGTTNPCLSAGNRAKLEEFIAQQEEEK